MFELFVCKHLSCQGPQYRYCVTMTPPHSFPLSKIALRSEFWGYGDQARTSTRISGIVDRQVLDNIPL